jgi:hypothetical protein
MMYGNNTRKFLEKLIYDEGKVRIFVDKDGKVTEAPSRG